MGFCESKIVKKPIYPQKQKNEIEEPQSNDLKNNNQKCQLKYPQKQRSSSLQRIFEKNEDKKSQQFQSSKKTNQILQKINTVILKQYHPISNFLFFERIGQGAECEVFKSSLRSQKKTKYYATRIIKGISSKNLFFRKLQIVIMKLYESPFILKHYFTYYYSNYLYVFVELMDGGNLTQLIGGERGVISVKCMSFLLRNIVCGLVELHKNHIIHRDIKSDNILLNLKGEVKISDFGFALVGKQRIGKRLMAGTAAWMAPQLIKHQQFDEKIDIWALGILAIELCDGQPPYLHQSHQQIFKKVTEAPPPSAKNCTSPQLSNFIEICLQKDSSQRPSSLQLLNHPFLQLFNEKQEIQTLCQLLQERKKQKNIQLIHA